MAENGVRYVPGNWNAVCTHCNEEKPISDFYLHSHGKPRKQCKVCHHKRGKYWKEQNREYVNSKARDVSSEQRERRLAATRKWRENNKAYDASRSASRRAKVKQATPSWANIDKIIEIYTNCPEGYHVDHIVPLNANNACGLHVEHNLQYLTAEENWRKGNGRERN